LEELERIMNQTLKGLHGHVKTSIGEDEQLLEIALT